MKDYLKIDLTQSEKKKLNERRVSLNVQDYHKDKPYYEIFKAFDKDKSGILTKEKIHTAINNLGFGDLIIAEDFDFIFDKFPEEKQKEGIMVIDFVEALAECKEERQDFMKKMDEILKSLKRGMKKNRRKSMESKFIVEEFKANSDTIIEILKTVKGLMKKLNIDVTNLRGKSPIDFSDVLPGIEERVKELLPQLDWSIRSISGGNIYESYLKEEENSDGSNGPLLTSSYSSSSISEWSSRTSSLNPVNDHIIEWISQAVTKRQARDPKELRIAKNEDVSLDASPLRRIKTDGPSLANYVFTSKLERDLPNLIQTSTGSINKLELIAAFNDRHYIELAESENIYDFDIFKYCKEVGRPNAMIMLFTNILEKNNLFTDSIIDSMTYPNFIMEVYNGYLQKVQYHNDLHALDVSHFCSYLLNEAKLIEIAELDSIDIAAYLVAAIVHDFKHPGFGNDFLIKSQHPLAIRYNDESVLENYHVAQAFKIIAKEDCNIFNKLNPNEKSIMRKRIIGCVLATDMARHFKSLSALNTILNTCNMGNRKNMEEYVRSMSGSEKFEAQQFLLNVSIHSADISTSTKKFSVALEWTDLLMDEFFNQGDTEKRMGLPVNMICDREKVSIPNAQMGFITGISLPFFETLAELLPNLDQFLDNLRSNAEEWRKLSQKNVIGDSIKEEEEEKEPEIVTSTDVDMKQEDK